MSQLIKNLVDVSEYINDGKKLFEEHVTPTEIKYKIVRGKYVLDSHGIPSQVKNSISIYNNPRYETLYYKVKKEIERLTDKRLYSALGLTDSNTSLTFSPCSPAKSKNPTVV